MDIKAKHAKSRTRVSCVSNCSHVFKATPKKGVWVVQSNPTNNRGVPKKVEVTVTVFECIHCGEKKEYPDTWEQNYVIPVRKKSVYTRLPKTTKKLKVKNA